MYYNFLIEIPKSQKITLNKQKNNTYVEYTYDRIYKPEKKYNVAKRKCIGKLSSDNPTMMYPNHNFLYYFPDVKFPKDKTYTKRSGCLRIGAYIVIKKIIKEYKLDEILNKIMGEKSGLCLDFASYSIVAENNAGQYYPEYAYNHPLFTKEMKIYSDSSLSDFFAEISPDLPMSFLNAWNSSRDHREKIYISYDSTNKNCQSGDIDIAEFGHPKNGKDYPVFNYAVAYDRNNQEPLFYEEYPGSIVDVAQLQIMLEKAKGYGYRNVGFILDRGYFSNKNIRFMDLNGYDFVIMVKGRKALVRELVLENRGSFEDNWNNNIIKYNAYGITIKRKLNVYDDKERYFHLYYSHQKCSSEKKKLETKINRMQNNLKKLYGRPVIIDKEYEHYFEPVYYHRGKDDQIFQFAIPKNDVISEELRLCGYFCIITSKKMSAKDALELYKSRDASEKLFREDKTFLGNRTLRVHSEESVHAKIFVEFVAMIIRNKIYTNLKDTAMEDKKRENYMNVPAAIKELEKIELVCQTDGEYHLFCAISATQKKILQAFQIDEAYVRNEVAEIKKCVKKYNKHIKK